MAGRSDKVYLSLSGGSGLSMSTLLNCPYKLWLIMQGWRLRLKTLPLVEGAMFHHYGEKLLLGESVEPELITEVALKGSWEDNQGRVMDYDIEEMANKKATKVQQMAVRLVNMTSELKKQHSKGVFGEIKPDYIERLVSCDLLLNPLTQAPDEHSKMLQDEGIVFSGRLDIFNGDSIQDLKTAKMKALEDKEKEEIAAVGYLEERGTHNAKTDFQLTEYSYMATMEAGALIEDVFFHIFTKHQKGCDYIPLRGRRDVWDLEKAFNCLKSAGKEFLRCENEGFEPMGQVRSNCKDIFNQQCAFHKHCFANRYGQKEIGLEEMDDLKNINEEAGDV